MKIKTEKNCTKRRRLGEKPAVNEHCSIINIGDDR